MYIQLGRPSYKISDLAAIQIDLASLKREIDIAVIDDNPFSRREQLERYGFRIREIGGDFASFEQVEAFPVVVCDIMGVGRSFGSEFEGAGVIAELRKRHPDKYLIAFTAATHNIRYNASLSKADASLEKDISTDAWVAELEKGLLSVGSPHQRWLRFRIGLIAQGVDAFHVFNLEQAYVKAIIEKSQKPLESSSLLEKIPNELRVPVAKFVATAVVQLLKLASNAP